MIKMEDNQNRRRPKWKTTKMEDDQNKSCLIVKHNLWNFKKKELILDNHYGVGVLHILALQDFYD